MEIRKLTDEMVAKMTTDVEHLTLEEPDNLKRSLQIISLIENTVREMKQVIIGYKFKSQQEEIYFFRNVKPAVMSQFLYYKKMLNIYLFESYNDAGSRMQYYQRYLKSLQGFMAKNIEFYRYVHSGDEQFDKDYFTRTPRGIKSLDLDERFSTSRDGTLAKILANELLKDYLNNVIKKLRHGNQSEHNRPVIAWTGSKTDLIELIYGLHASGVFNKASADLKQIATYFETMFDVNLGNYYRTFQEIRIRKSGQTNFLDQVKEKLLGKIQELDS